MESENACEGCGSTEFAEVDGAYYCTGCNAQSQSLGAVLDTEIQEAWTMGTGARAMLNREKNQAEKRKSGATRKTQKSRKDHSSRANLHASATTDFPGGARLHRFLAQLRIAQDALTAFDFVPDDFPLRLHATLAKWLRKEGVGFGGEPSPPVPADGEEPETFFCPLLGTDEIRPSAELVKRLDKIRLCKESLLGLLYVALLDSGLGQTLGAGDLVRWLWGGHLRMERDKEASQITLGFTPHGNAVFAFDYLSEAVRMLPEDVAKAKLGGHEEGMDAADELLYQLNLPRALLGCVRILVEKRPPRVYDLQTLKTFNAVREHGRPVHFLLPVESKSAAYVLLAMKLALGLSEAEAEPSEAGVFSFRAWRAHVSLCRALLKGTPLPDVLSPDFVEPEGSVLSEAARAHTLMWEPHFLEASLYPISQRWAPSKVAEVLGAPLPSDVPGETELRAPLRYAVHKHRDAAETLTGDFDKVTRDLLLKDFSQERLPGPETKAFPAFGRFVACQERERVWWERRGHEAWAKNVTRGSLLPGEPLLYYLSVIAPSLPEPEEWLIALLAHQTCESAHQLFRGLLLLEEAVLQVPTFQWDEELAERAQPKPQRSDTSKIDRATHELLITIQRKNGEEQLIRDLW